METVGRYQLVKKIATGGMAEIWLARETRPDGFRTVALKRILPHLAESPEFSQMFLHEARVAVRLNHPNIVQIYDLGLEGTSLFIAMEYIRGDDARRLWKHAIAERNPIPVPLVCRIAMEAASGLGYAHDKTDQDGAPLHIIHRDVSPQNILVSFEGAVKVADFGIAKAADQAVHTRSGVLKGKYSYMSPEQSDGREVDPRSDQFSLGVVLYELLTCQRLFKRRTEIQTLAAVAMCRVEPPSKVNPRVPPELDPIVTRALARDPERRYPDMGAFRAALGDWLAAGGHAVRSEELAGYLRTVYAVRLAQESLGGVAPGDEPPGPDSEPVLAGHPTERAGDAPAADLARPSGVAAATTERGAPAVPRDVGRPSMTGSGVTTTVGSADTGRFTRAVKRVGLVPLAAGASLSVAAATFGLLWAFARPEPPVADAGAAAAAERPVPLRVGSLDVASAPPGATVAVDGRARPGATPLTVGDLALGDHEVEASLDGHRPARQIVRLTRPGEAARVELSLEPSEVELVVETSPPGAQAHVGGSAVGTTPVTVRVPPGRAVEIAATLEGFVAARKLVTPGGEVRAVQFELERTRAPAGTLFVTSEPAATVREGARVLGQTPWRGRLAAGRHRLVLDNPARGLEQSFAVNLKDDETLERRFAFKSGEIQLVVRGAASAERPQVPEVEVLLHGYRLGVTPLPAFALVAGEHVLTLVARELGRTKQVRLTVAAGERRRVEVTLDD